GLDDERGLERARACWDRVARIEHLARALVLVEGREGPQLHAEDLHDVAGLQGEASGQHRDARGAELDARAVELEGEEEPLGGEGRVVGGVERRGICWRRIA